MTVEFFLLLPLVIVVLLAGVQVVEAAKVHIELQGAVREGVRVAATTPDPAMAVIAVTNALDPTMAGRARIAVRRPAQAGATATVTAAVRHQVRLWLLPDLAFDISARAAMRTER